VIALRRRLAHGIGLFSVGFGQEAFGKAYAQLGKDVTGKEQRARLAWRGWNMLTPSQKNRSVVGSCAFHRSYWTGRNLPFNLVSGACGIYVNERRSELTRPFHCSCEGHVCVLSPSNHDADEAPTPSPRETESNKMARRDFWRHVCRIGQQKCARRRRATRAVGGERLPRVENSGA
jgi:hypothetical protein